MSDVVARRYAQALMDVVGDEDLDGIAAALDRVVAVTEQAERQLGEVLESPVFTVVERRAVIDQVVGKLKLPALVTNLVRLANDKRRMALLPGIASAFRDLADRRAGRVRVTVMTAEPLTPPLEAEVRAALEAMTGKSVIVRTEVRPDLIGGLVAKIGDKVYDSSLRTRLELIQQQLLSSPVALA
ncbi:MAG: ATP synthase F1 subunit delta [Myxococcota bacterium]